MIIDAITDDIIQRTLDEGGKVYAFNSTDRFEVVSAGNGKITINSGQYEFAVGDKISLIYEPKYTHAWCDEYSDLDGDGIIDLVDFDKDGDGVVDPTKPVDPTFVITQIMLEPNAPSLVTLEMSASDPKFVRSRLWGYPVVVDGWYPLYMTEAEALYASPMAEPDAHPHELSSHDELGDVWQYWMPLGVNQWHGNYSNCPPMEPDLNYADSVETYDFEYVDRVAGAGLFASIIPYDYRDRILGIDRDENGTYESQVDYRLEQIVNVQDVLDEFGQVVERGDLSSANYITTPQQAWLYEITQKDTSENVLPDVHSFRENNHVYYASTFTKFDLGTEESDLHTASKYSYFSKLANGSNAQFNMNTGAVIWYLHINDDGTDEWKKVVPLEINADGFFVLDDDIFSVGKRVYIVEDYPPEQPSTIRVTVTHACASPSNVQAERLPERPEEVNWITAGLMPVPNTPSLVEVSFFTSNQEIVWDQF